MGILFANDASSTLQAGVTSGATQIVVATADAGLFPSPSGGSYFLATVVDSSGNMEIMKCTARLGNTLTVARGQEGTTAFAFTAGAIVDLRLTKGTMEALTQVTGESLPSHNHLASQITNLSATTVPFTPVGNIASTSVQAAIAELDAEKATASLVIAGNIPFTPVGNIAANTVAGALAELDAEKVPLNGTGATGNWNITVAYLGGNQQVNEILGATKSLAMVGGNDTERGSFTCRADGSGDNNLAGISFWNNTWGTKLGVRGDGYFGVGGWSHAAWRWYVDPSGNMTAAGNITAYSDERKKKDWRDLAPDFLTALADVRMGTYERIDTGVRQVGVSAQSLQPVLPEAVLIGEDGDYLTVAYGNAALAAAVALAREVVSLRAEVEALKKQGGAS